MELTGYIAILFFFTAAGFYASFQLERRIKQLKTLEKAFMYMIREIDYRLSPLEDAFLHTAKKAGYPWDLFYQELGEKMNGLQGGSGDPEELTTLAVEHIKKFHPWEKDLDILISLGKGLGDLDKTMQLSKLQMAEEEIRQAQIEAGEELSKKGKLYQTLGICMGILCVIVLI